MPVLSSLEPHKHNLCKTVWDDGSELPVHLEVLQLSDLHPGVFRSEEELEELSYRTELCIARERALYLLGLGNYSAWEVRRKLRKFVSDEAAEETVGILAESGVLDDAAFASLLAEDSVRLKGWGSRRILQELRARGIDSELARNAVEALPESGRDDERGRILQILQHKYRDLSDQKLMTRAINGLLRLGYRYEDIRAVLKEYTESEMDELE